MIPELEPIWRQLTETDEALREALAQVPDDRLIWRPAPGANSVAVIVQHIARANLGYANIMEVGERGERWELEEGPGRARLLERLGQSMERVRETFERMTPEALERTCATDWNPLGPEVAGPLDAFWFALQMVRHSAYHLGQINVYLQMWESESAR